MAVKIGTTKTTNNKTMLGRKRMLEGVGEDFAETLIK
jgi:hypothetical protein